MTTTARSSVNLAIGLDAADLLRAQGYRVVVSRTSDTTVVRLTPADVSGNLLSVVGVHDDVAARDVCANLAKADAFAGIYMDAGASSSNAGSTPAITPPTVSTAGNSIRCSSYYSA